ncbi:MAG: aminotransferase class III-fold pyridoxal phosphate-dependent enzyme [Gammaproteobacteria bacterium]
MQATSFKHPEGPISRLTPLRQCAGAALTQGLSDEVIEHYAKIDPTMMIAIDDAVYRFFKLKAEFPELIDLDETEQIERLQDGFVNFYRQDAVCPFVALAGKGPWIVTAKGAVLHDSGGYGMLGFGHAPDSVLAAMNANQVMANIMTPSFSHLRFDRAIRREVGNRNQNKSPFDRFLCINSGSESVTVGARIADINAKLLTDEGARHAGKPRFLLAHDGAFHGRTDRPAKFSDSTIGTYKKHLASFRDSNRLLTVEPNNIAELESVFAKADAEGFFIEAFFIEPVMGEGNPGQAVSREFYDAARRLTLEHGSILLVDSIQAGLRAQGCLSIVDYPGFEDCEAPDMETYSKALNAGQFPLSVLALTDRAAALYRKGVYGNTMTTNPRALDAACAVLDMVDDGLRDNIRRRGAELVSKLEVLKDELGGAITQVQGTGLLASCELNVERFKSYGAGSVEEHMRKKGINIIHGGHNALRYTPHFRITSAEIDMLVAATREALSDG